MHFPGTRIAKHYFPVTKKATSVDAASAGADRRWYVVGLDEIIVDVEIYGPAELAHDLDLVLGESVQLCPEHLQRVLAEVRRRGIQPTYAAGGTVANSLNNYTHLCGEPAVLLGAMPRTIETGGPSFAYVAQTSKAVDLGNLLPLSGDIGTAITFLAPDGERSFGVAPGVSSDYPSSAVDADVVENASMALTSLYLLRSPERPIYDAALRFMTLARDAGVPVAFGLGTSSLVREKRDLVREVLTEYVTVVAMNAQEAEALTGESDVLLSAQTILDWVDAVVITEGANGLTLGAYTDDQFKRETRETVYSKSIAEYNRWEYSRMVRRADCEKPVKVYSHTHPYRGGPDRLSNTSGAGDAALAAILHDIAANAYHRTTVPNSQKHVAGSFLSYSSLSRNAQYGNRVAYEVLRGRSPCLNAPIRQDDEP